VEIHDTWKGIAAINKKLKIHLPFSLHLVIFTNSATGMQSAQVVTTSNISAILISG
jgi:hypothetical protein